MEKHFNFIFNSLPSLDELKEKVFISTPRKKIFVSPFAGSSKSLFVKSISGEEKQIVLLCPTVQSVNETKVELSILGQDENVIAVDDLSVETLQERLTDLNKRERFILISTYDLLKQKLPPKNSIDKNTTKIEIGGNLTYDEIILVNTLGKEKLIKAYL